MLLALWACASDTAATIVNVKPGTAQLRTLRTITEPRRAGSCDRVTRGLGIPDLAEQSYLGGMIDEGGIRRRWEAIGSKLDEREAHVCGCRSAYCRPGWTQDRGEDHRARPLDDQPRRGRP